MEQSEMEKLLLAARGKLRLYAFSLTSDWERAEDLLQETSLRVLNAAGNFKDKGKFFSWAREIMLNAFLNNAKREEHYQCVEQLGHTTLFANSEQDDLYIDTDIDIEEIYNAIDELPGNSGKVMQLLVSGHKYMEIAVLMNIPIGTVKTRINISRTILKHKLKDYLN